MDALREMIQEIQQTHTQTNCEDYVEVDVCPVCRNLGFVLIDDGGQGTAVECKCGIRKRTIINNCLAFAKLPNAFQKIRKVDYSKDAYENADSRKTAEIAIRCVDYWLDNFEVLKERGMGLYLYSKTKGSGKTMMAAGIANDLMRVNKCQVKFCTSLQILNEIKSTWGNGGDGKERKLLRHLSTAEVLIIDDFGAEQSDKPWINERFYQIINNRYVDKKVTIFTSNDRLDFLKYDDRITNRIKERVFQVPFPEESVRDIIAKRNMTELAENIKNM